MGNDIVYEENSERTRLRDALLVIEKSNHGTICPYCKPPTRGKRKFQPVKLGDCKKLWDHGKWLSECMTLVSKAQHRYHTAVNDKAEKMLESIKKSLDPNG